MVRVDHKIIQGQYRLLYLISALVMGLGDPTPGQSSTPGKGEKFSGETHSNQPLIETALSINISIIYCQLTIFFSTVLYEFTLILMVLAVNINGIIRKFKYLYVIYRC